MKKKNKTKHFLLLLFLVSLSLIIQGQGIIVDFQVIKQCKNHTEFHNSSTSGISDTIIGYLWIITNPITEDTIAETTTENPILSFENSGEYKVTLFALSIIASHKAINSVTKTVEIVESPDVEIKQWDDVICSNADSSVFEIEKMEGYNYQWDTSDIPDNYLKGNSGLNSNKLKLQWGELELSEGALQFNLSCTITSGFSDGKCETMISQPLVLLSSSVPTSTNIKIIPKAGDNSILFCIIDNPENYLYDWGYLENNLEKIESKGSQDNYYQFKEGLIASRSYFVDILNKDFTYCKIRKWYNRVKNDSKNIQQDTEPLIQVLNVYPNPAKDIVNFVIFNSTGIDQEITASLFNFMGSFESIHHFELAKNVSTIAIPTHVLRSGTYYIRFEISGNQSIVKKFVVINNQ